MFLSTAAFSKGLKVSSQSKNKKINSFVLTMKCFLLFVNIYTKKSVNSLKTFKVLQ